MAAFLQTARRWLGWRGEGDAAPTQRETEFGFWVGAAFCTNMIIGCGILGIPQAFAKSGVIFGPIVIIFFCFLMNMSKDYMVEVSDRAEALANARAITARCVRDGSGSHDGDLAVKPTLDECTIVTERKFEVADLFAIFIGPRARTVYIVILGGYMYGALWAYSSVFASSFSANVPLTVFGGSGTCNVAEAGAQCGNVFHVWLAVFAVLAIPLACMDLKEQLFVQILMFAARILVTLLFTGTVLAGFGCNGVVFAELPPDHEPNTPFFEPAGLSTLIPVSIYAFIFHHSVPILAQPIADKKSVRWVFFAALAITCACYLSLGFLVALYFGDKVDSQCNLNWQNYVGCMAAPAAYGNSTGAACTSQETWGASCVDVASRPAYASVISMIVLIFPALDVLSAFPLNAVTLGNNLMSACLGDAAIIPPEDEEEAHRLLDTSAGHVVPVSVAHAGGEDGSVPAEYPVEESDSVSTPLTRKVSSIRHRQRTSDPNLRSHADEAAVAESLNPVLMPAAPRPWYLRTKRAHRIMVVLFRLLAAVPPVVGAAFKSDLGNILQFTGTIGVAIAFLIPVTLRLYSFARTRTLFVALSTLVRRPADAKVAAAAASLPSVAAVTAPDAASHALPDEEGIIARVRAVPITVIEALQRVPGVDAQLPTPDTVWLVNYRIPEALFVVFVAVAIYIIIEITITLSQ